MEEVQVVSYNAEELTLVYSTNLNNTIPVQIVNNTEIILNDRTVDVNEIVNTITSARARVRIELNGEIITRLEINI